MHVCIHVQGCCVRKRISFHVMFYFIKAPYMHAYIHTNDGTPYPCRLGYSRLCHGRDCRDQIQFPSYSAVYMCICMYVCRGWIRLGSPPAAQGGVQLQNAHGARVLGLVLADVEEYIVQTFHHWPATQTGQLQIRWWWWWWWWW